MYKAKMHIRQRSSIDSKIRSAYIGYRDRVFEINDTHHKRSDLWF